MFKRIAAYFRAHKVRLLGWASAVVFILCLVTIGAANNAVKPADTAPVPLAVQVSNVALEKQSTLSAESISKSETLQAAGIVPVQFVSTSRFVNLITAPNASIPTVYINRTRNLISTVYYTSLSSKNPTIYASYYLDTQLPEITTAFDAKNSDISVLSPAATTTNTTQSVGYGSSRGGFSSSTGPTGVNAYDPALNTTTVTQTQPAAPANPWSVAASILITIMLSIWLMTFLFRMIRQVRMGTIGGGSKKAVAGSDVPDTRFSDVAGCDEAIEEMSELVSFLREPDRFRDVGANPPRGALLIGPPGTGKTLLARAVAGEAGVPFYSAAGSDFVEMYVGVGAKRIRDIFAKARTHKEGAIIFIDEIDAVGRARSSRADTGGNTENENTLNALLVEMDGFAKSNVIVLGATNRDDILDKALLRPGRFDRQVQVPLPDRAGRERILAVHATGKPFEEGTDWNLIARRTPGMSGADLAQLINEACLVAGRENRTVVTEADLDAAVATVAMGKARTSAVVTDHDRNITAWHEAGHTVCAMVLPEADDPVSVSIIPRGPAGGVTWMAQGDDLFLTRKRAIARLVVAMGGRAAEEIHLDGEFTSGPHGDLSAATQTALAMVTQYGMTDTGLMIRSGELLATGAKMTDETVAAVENLLAEALHTARKTLADNRGLLEKVVAALLENDTLTNADLLALRAGEKISAPKLGDAPVDYRRPPTPERTQPRPVNVRSKLGALAAAAQAAANAWDEALPKVIRKRKDRT